MFQNFDAIRLFSEVAYTFIIVFLHFFIFFKTKDIYELTGYQGIRYFRNAFLFFGLAYASRFLFFVIFFGITTIFPFIPRKFMMLLLIILVGYLSTIGIFYLIYSIIWERVPYPKFIVTSNLFALVVSIVAYFSGSIRIISLIQMGLLIFSVILLYKVHHKINIKSNTKLLYSLIALLWFINLIVFGPRRLIDLEIKIFFQVISLGVMTILVYKVLKWIK